MVRPNRRVGVRAVLLLSWWFISVSVVRAQPLPSERLSEWISYNNLGWQAAERGDLALAEFRFRRAIERIRPYEANDRRLLARSYNDLARILFVEKRYDDAEPLARWALSVREHHPRVKPESVFQSLYLLAEIQLARRRVDEVVSLLKRALAIQEASQGRGHPETAPTLVDLAGVLRDQGHHAESESLYKRAVAIQEKDHPTENLALAGTLLQYAILLRKTDRGAEAEALEARAKAIQDVVETRAAAFEKDQQRRAQGRSPGP